MLFIKFQIFGLTSGDRKITANEPFYTACFDVAQLAFIEEEIMCRVDPLTCKDRKRGWGVGEARTRLFLCQNILHKIRRQIDSKLLTLQFNTNILACFGIQNRPHLRFLRKFTFIKWSTKTNHSKLAV